MTLTTTRGHTSITQADITLFLNPVPVAYKDVNSLYAYAQRWLVKIFLS